MIRSALRRAGAVLALVTVLGATAMASTAVAQPTGPGIASLHGSWSCTIPPGYTYQQERRTTRCGIHAYEYYLLDYVNYNLTGYIACQVPPGYTYTQERLSVSCAAGGFRSYEYRLQKY